MSNPLSEYRSNISITIRVDLLQQADERASAEKISRSALFELAMKEYLAKNRKYYCENHDRFVKIRHNQNDIVCGEDNCHYIIATYNEDQVEEE